MQKRIMVVQNAGELPSAVHDALKGQAFEVMYVEGFPLARRSALAVRPALVLIDIDCWDKSVEELLFEFGNLRSTRSSRKIILASSAKVDDKVLALEVGADDFLLKPISTRELAARLEAVLRCYVPIFQEEEVQVFGSLRLRRNGMEVFVGDNERKLSRTEFNLLAFLMDHPGHVLSREVLLENLWLPSGEVEYPRIVDVYVCRLREKIEEDPAYPTKLVTRRGHGYSLIDPTAQEAAALAKIPKGTRTDMAPSLMHSQSAGGPKFRF